MWVRRVRALKHRRKHERPPRSSTTGQAVLRCEARPLTRSIALTPNGSSRGGTTVEGTPTFQDGGWRDASKPEVSAQQGVLLARAANQKRSDFVAPARRWPVGGTRNISCRARHRHGSKNRHRVPRFAVHWLRTMSAAAAATTLDHMKGSVSHENGARCHPALRGRSALRY
jgi:hypothetical protein